MVNYSKGTAESRHEEPMELAALDNMLQNVMSFCKRPMEFISQFGTSVLCSDMKLT